MKNALSSLKFFSFSCSLLIFFSLFAASGVGASDDDYEDDNEFQNANVIWINPQETEDEESGYESLQTHNFYDAGDEDWVKFYARSGETYKIVAEPSPGEAGKNCDPIIGVYKSDGQTLVSDHKGKEEDIGNVGEEEFFEWNCTADGIYYARIRQCDPDIVQECLAQYGDGTQYSLQLTKPHAAFNGLICGTIVPATESIVIMTDVAEAIVLSDGTYYIPHGPGTFTLTATDLSGLYETYSETVTVEEFGKTRIDIKLVYKGDVSGDGYVNLGDALLALKVLAGMSTEYLTHPKYAASGADVNGDGKIGFEELLYVLRILSDKTFR
ncbi:dockerin type I repeat-containing protein [Desulfonema magnum]|uniref:Dockerin domain-containing protein n=1 Tax=Desulfonema magnum TaxID=45655 RepID=A0A975BG51_9BACT|nr:dockerin type I repeat-containing protein [Desulfonema magnum]QTA84892.1 Dockerin domain-containing protein [Desulfonema magnum]